MKICLWCGTSSTDEKETCPQCGRPIYKEKVAQAPIPEPVPDPDKSVEKVVASEPEAPKPAEVLVTVAPTVEIPIETSAAEKPVETSAAEEETMEASTAAIEQNEPTPPKE